MNISEEITLGRMKASYEVGKLRGHYDADVQARIAAFAAIRRAATLVRAHDELANILGKFQFSKDEANRLRAESLLMRMTIRAAIGSDKS